MKTQWMILLTTTTLFQACTSAELQSEIAQPVAIPSSQPNESAMATATGWSELKLQANFAKTTLDAMGHFETTRNACGKDAFGVLELEPWNRLVGTLNQVATETLLTEPRCAPTENYSKMDGVAELVTPEGKRTIVDASGWQLCTYIRDPAFAQKVFEILEYVVLSADKEECPNGWGSG